MASSANAYAAKKEGKFTIDEVMKVVVACGAAYGSDEHYIATQLFVKKEQREMFMTLPTDDVRLNSVNMETISLFVFLQLYFIYSICRSF
jgi:hypothetical protein